MDKLYKVWLLEKYTSYEAMFSQLVEADANIVELESMPVANKAKLHYWQSMYLRLSDIMLDNPNGRWVVAISDMDYRSFIASAKKRLREDSLALGQYRVCEVQVDSPMQRFGPFKCRVVNSKVLKYLMATLWSLKI